jgi:acyl carrier protein
MSEVVRDVFINELGLEPALFHPELAYNSVPEWDSASHMVLVVALEEKLGIEFDSDEIANLTSVARIVEALAAKGVAVE